MVKTIASKRGFADVFSANSILGSKFAIMSAGMDGLSLRMQVNSNNLNAINSGATNIDAQKVDFGTALRSALNQSNDATGSSQAAANGAVDSLTGAGALDQQFTVTSDSSLDNDPEQAKDKIVSQMSQDSVMYQVLSQQVANRITELKSVISGMGA